MSPELEAFLECKDRACCIVASKVKVLSWQLYADDVIGYDGRKAIRESGEDKAGAGELITSIENSIREDSSKLQKLLKVLEKDQETYREWIKKALQGKTTMTGKNRPSSISLQEKPSRRNTTLPMNRSESMVFSKHKTLHLPAGSELLVSKRKSLERTQLYKKLNNAKSSASLPEHNTGFPASFPCTTPSVQQETASLNLGVPHPRAIRIPGSMRISTSASKITPKFPPTPSQASTEDLNSTESSTIIHKETQDSSLMQHLTEFADLSTGVMDEDPLLPPPPPSLPSIPPSIPQFSSSEIVKSKFSGDTNPTFPPIAGNLSSSTTTISKAPIKPFQKYKEDYSDPTLTENTVSDCSSQSEATPPIKHKPNSAAAVSDDILLESAESSSENLTLDDAESNLVQLEKLLGKFQSLVSKQRRIWERVFRTRKEYRIKEVSDKIKKAKKQINKQKTTEEATAENIAQKELISYLRSEIENLQNKQRPKS